MAQDKQTPTGDKQYGQLERDALHYHEFPTPGKLTILPTKQMGNKYDLALAYSPGVATPCLEIERDPSLAARYTARGNLVGVVTNGTAVLGLGDIGPLAAKPVMEGKAVLFKKFAGVDVYDIEVDEKDPGKLVDVIAAIGGTFGAINLEDIKAPECFHVERELQKRLDIPVFHDDQHGTAIVVAAAVVNGLKVIGKKIEDIKLVVSGAGAAAMACTGLLVKMGLKRENVWVTDIGGLVYEGRTEGMNEQMAIYAQKSDKRTLAEVIDGADMFMGLSAGGVLKPAMVASMADKPLILALANPNPEILPEQVKEVRDDAVMATGRSDYPNQVNNVLCFPYIFRGALDCGATAITDEMKIATVHAIAELARAEQHEVVARAYADETLSFGPEYLIPKPFDPRLILRIAPAVARAAAESGVASRPITDFEAYDQKLRSFIFASGATMRPIFEAASHAKKKHIAYAEGEEERVLRAVQIIVDQGIARPTLIGRPAVIKQRIEKFGLRLVEGQDYDVVNTESDERYRDFWQSYYQMTQREGVTVEVAKIEMRQRLTLIGAMLLKKGEVDGLICGLWNTTAAHLHYIDQVIGKRQESATDSSFVTPVFACMNGLLLPGRQVFLADTHVNYDPSAEELAQIAILGAEELKRFGLEPKVALLSHSNFGSILSSPSGHKMRETLAILRDRAPWMNVDGEMHGDVALDGNLRQSIIPGSILEGDANLLIFPHIDAANIAYNLLKTAAGGNIAIGPILLGAGQPVHILTAAATVRRIVNMTALTIVDANAAGK